MKKRSTTAATVSIKTEISVSKSSPVHSDICPTHREFGGAKGAVGLMIFSHCVLYYFWISQEFYSGAVISPVFFNESTLAFLHRMQGHIVDKAMPTVFTCAVYWGFLLLQLVLAFVMPGIVVQGFPVPSQNNERLEYHCNGLAGWWFTLVFVFALHWTGVFRLGWLVDHFGSLMTCAIGTANLISIGLFALGRPRIRMSGNIVYDFFMGATLNPRITSRVDVKMWAEIRVSWILLFLLTTGAACKQYEEQGRVSLSMVFMVVAHFLYTNACQKGEECIPLTWDMFYEKFGWMLIFWNFAGVPFLYCFQSYYIYRNQIEFSNPFYYIPLYLLLFASYFVWDTAQSQKARFKMKSKTPLRWYAFPQLPWNDLMEPKFLQTKNGGRLLVDGWFRYARKVYYFADMVMALTWGLSCGMSGALPYFYPLFFTTMLMHRYLRDVERCREKYKQDWERYCQLVPYAFIPYVF